MEKHEGHKKTDDKMMLREGSWEVVVCESAC